MHKLSLAGIDIKKQIYVCEDYEEAAMARSYGISYVVRPEGMDDTKLIAIVLWDTLHKMFSHIDWRMFLRLTEDDINSVIIYVPGGEASAHDTCTGDSDVVDIAVEERTFSGGFDDVEDDYCERKLYEYIGDQSAKVSIEELQALHLLPEFLSDIGEAIKKGKAPVDFEVENALLKRALGYDYEETITEVYGDGKKHVKKVKRHVPPDVGAICFWLKNRKPEKFRDRPDAEKKPEEGVKVIIDV